MNQNERVSSDVPRQSPVDPAEAHALAERFAPILKLDSRELFVPIRQQAYIGDTQLKQEDGRVDTLLNAAPSLDTLPATEGSCLLIRHCLYFLDVRGVEPDPPKHSEKAYASLEQHLIRRGEKPTVYAHVTHYDDTGEYAIQYWFLYLFNYRLNEHESDWEQITLRLDEDKKPVDAFYSEHNGGVVKPWAKVQKDGDHPVDYPALGSHANYFTHGIGNSHTVTLDCRQVLHRRFCTGNVTIRDHSDGRGPTLEVGRDYKVRELTGPVFVGSYGSGNYVVLTRKPDILADPRTRPIWADPLAPMR